MRNVEYSTLGDKGESDVDLNFLFHMYTDLLLEREPHEQYWKLLNRFLLPAKGLSQLDKRPVINVNNRKEIINPKAKDSLNILSSGLYELFTSPAQDWFYALWSNKAFEMDDFLKRWMQESTQIVKDGLLDSSFYDCMYNFYKEKAGFGTASIYSGGDTTDNGLYRFVTQTIGEYVFTVDARGQVDTYFRTHFFTPRQLIKEFGEENMPQTVLSLAENRGGERIYFTVLECTWYRKFMDKPITQSKFLLESSNYGTQIVSDSNSIFLHELQRSGFYEFPYHLSRWDVISNDTWGTGPGHDTLPNNRRLQEFERSLLLGTHKNVEPPTLASARLKGELSTLPGARTWSNNPNDRVENIYNVRMDYAGIHTAIERTERSIETGFFVDVFLTSMRDPNASPLRTGQVNMIEDERLIRLSPMAGRTIRECLTPLLTRAFNIAQRKGALPELPDQYKEMLGDGDYTVKYVSPLAQAQQLRSSRKIQDFVSITGGVASVLPKVLDKLDGDAIIEEIAEKTNTPQKVFLPDQVVKRKRDEREAVEQKQAAQQEQIMQRQMQLSESQAQADISKTLSEAGANANDVLANVGL